MSAILEIKRLEGGYYPHVDVLHDIDLRIEDGEVIGILGLNGSGKSTLGKAIMNMIPYRKGQIILKGEDVTALKTHELSRKGISIMQQGGQVFQTISVWENLEMAMGKDVSVRVEQLKDIIPFLSTPRKELQKKMADKLSGGQRHQLAFAMALATRPTLLILDEPSAGLSPKAVQQMYTIIKKAQSDMQLSVILIEQNISKAVEFCSKTLLISTGTILREFDNKSVSDVEKELFPEN